ncbi:hypothetical protein [Corynebacterium aquilae]|uniref:hypothetical protein n=1 Tax=Corynebacterium aquilae TaxID=203263 RepID=UPI000952E798|nr:hypothetical protein [Corynebacterium aquilae]
MTTTELAISLALIAAATLITTPPPRTRTHPTPTHRRPHPTLLLHLIPTACIAAITHNPLIALNTTLITGTIHWSIRHHRTQRAHHRDTHTTAAILTTLIANLRAGAHPTQALAHTATHLPDNTPPAIATTIGAAARHPDHGPRILSTSPHPHLKHIGHLLTLANQHGIAPTPLLVAHRNHLDHTLDHHATTRAHLKGPQATATTLTILPALGIAMGETMGAHPTTYLLTTTTGNALLTIGVLLTLAGHITTTTIISRAATP